MIELTTELDLAANSGIILSLISTYPGAYFKAREPLEGELRVSMMKRDLEGLLARGVSERIIADQTLVANRVDDLLSGIRGKAEDAYFSLGRWMSGSSRHSLVLMCSYGDGSPLVDLKLGRYRGNDFLKGNSINLMGEDTEVRKTLREMRSREGVGSLVINGHYGLYHSGVQLPNIDLDDLNYTDSIEKGSKTEAMLEFSRNHPTYGNDPVWFYRLNGHKSIIQNGVEHKLYKE
ncbi:hypothetical protein HYV89_05180 [Candidatus Woesearchaeota archaeon]|nr:hypothetical protein [Candidatus Woesearchaeota archaeon]